MDIYDPQKNNKDHLEGQFRIRYFNENAEHYLLHCNRFPLSRIIMLFEINKLNLIGIPVNIDLLLIGNETLNCDINCSIFLAVQKYIKNTCRFSMSRS
jgi:hypothetical protein